MTTPRSPLRVVDLVAGLVFTGLGALIGLVMLAYMVQLSELRVICDGVSPDGLRCDPVFLNVMTIVGIAIVVFAWFFTVGFFVVRVIRRQRAFFLPLIGIGIMIAGYYLVLIVLSASYQPV